MFTYNDSFLCQRYKLPKRGSEIEVELFLYWNEKRKMLKLSVPTPFKEDGYLGQIACGREMLRNDGTESLRNQSCYLKMIR